jgi:hypothetical protein
MLLRAGVRGLALAAAALAVLSAIAMRPARVCAQPRQDQEPHRLQQQMAQASGAMMEGNGPDHVDIPQLPSITMTAVPGYGVAPLVVGFFVNTVDPAGQGFVSYVWNFGDGQVSMDPPLTFFHTYTTAGNYVAMVNATTADGRTAIAYVAVTVRPAVLN